MNAQCHHIGIITVHADDLVSFYADKLGFEVMGAKTVPQDLMASIFRLECSGKLVKMKMGEAVLEIISPEDGVLENREVRHEGINHWSLGVPDRDEYLSSLEERGVEPLEYLKGNQKIVFVEDPDGNLVEIYKI